MNEFSEKNVAISIVDKVLFEGRFMFGFIDVFSLFKVSLGFWSQVTIVDVFIVGSILSLLRRDFEDSLKIRVRMRYSSIELSQTKVS